MSGLLSNAGLGLLVLLRHNDLKDTIKIIFTLLFISIFSRFFNPIFNLKFGIYIQVYTNLISATDFNNKRLFNITRLHFLDKN